MTRNDAIQLLRRHAAQSPEFHDVIKYQPHWMPHAWAIDALMEATNGATVRDFKQGLMISTDLPVRSKGGRVEFGADASMPVGGHHGRIPGLHVTELQPGIGWPGISKDDFKDTVPAAAFPPFDGVEDAQLAEKRAVRDLGILDGEGSGHPD